MSLAVLRAVPGRWIAPCLVRLWVFDHFNEGGLGIPDEEKGGKDEKSWARWRTWLEAIEGRKSIHKAASDRNH